MLWVPPLVLGRITLQGMASELPIVLLKAVQRLERVGRRGAENMNLTIKKLHPDAVLPAYAHEGDSGMDLRAVEDVVLLPGVPTLVKTGLAVELPEGGAAKMLRDGEQPSIMVPIVYEAQIRPRSGLALKHGVTVVNSPGTVDSGFRGEIGVILRWDGYSSITGTSPLTDARLLDEAPFQRSYRICKGDRIAQMVIAPVVRCVPAWGEVGETERGSGGFGSTGK